MKKLFILSFIVVLTQITTPVYAFLDLTSFGNDGFINGAYFTPVLAQPTGTGKIHSFVRLQTNKEIEEGYNTSGRNLLFDENNSPQFTRDLLLIDVPLVNLPNESNVPTLYREFLLDINEKNPTSSDRFLSLDRLKIYLGSAGGLLEGDPDDLGDLIYEMSNDNIKLDYGLNSGSGSGDMLAYIPDSLFQTSSNKYVYLYSRFGDEFSNTAGFEEWAVLSNNPVSLTNPVPEPATLLLFGSCFGVAAIFRRRKR